MIVRRSLFLVSLVLAGRIQPAGAEPPSAADLVQRIRSELPGPLTDDSKPHPGVPHGEFIEGTITDSRIYPGTETASASTSPPSTTPPGRRASSSAWTDSGRTSPRSSTT